MNIIYPWQVVVSFKENFNHCSRRMTVFKENNNSRVYELGSAHCVKEQKTRMLMIKEKITFSSR